MRFEKQDKLFLLLKKYEIDREKLINWFEIKKKKNVPFCNFIPNKIKSCMMESTADGVFCSIVHKYNCNNVCDNCVFYGEQGNYDDAKSVVELIIKIIK